MVVEWYGGRDWLVLRLSICPFSVSAPNMLPMEQEPGCKWAQSAIAHVASRLRTALAAGPDAAGPDAAISEAAAAERSSLEEEWRTAIARLCELDPTRVGYYRALERKGCVTSSAS